MGKQKYQTPWRKFPREAIQETFPKLPSPELREIWVCQKDDYTLLVVSTLEGGYFWRGKHKFYGEGDSRVTDTYFSTINEAKEAVEEWAKWNTAANS